MIPINKKWVRIQILVFSIFTIISFILLQEFIFTVSQVNGNSMAPNYDSGKFVLVQKHPRHIEDGDVVILKAPDKKHEFYIKRIIGQNQDTIAYEGNHLKRNGIYMSEHYLGKNVKTNDFVWTLNNSVKIPEGNFFVLGDNRELSRDSRNFGLISEDCIVGKVILQY